MRGTFGELRDARPGRWLLIRTDGPEAETGTLLFVHEDPKRVGKALVDEPDGDNGAKSAPFTWSIPDDDELPAFIL